jgi:hypothetical protein
MKFVNFIATYIIFYIASAISPAWSQATDQSVCQILANKITPDISNQTSTYDRFTIFKQLISDQRYQSYDTASNTSLDAGLSVVGYVDLFLGTTSNSSNWATNWQKFLQSTYYQSSSSFDSSNFQSKWSTDLITAVANCNNFYGLITSVSPGQDSFTLKLHGIGQWQLLGVSISPPDPLFQCGGDEKATTQQPLSFVNDHLVVCQKDHNVTVSIAIHDSQADVGPFIIYSVADNLRKKQESEVKQIQSSINALQSQLTQTNSATAAQIAQIRNGLSIWNNDFQFSPPNGSVQPGGPPVPNVGPYGGDGSILCNNGYYVVGLYVFRESAGLNGLQLICRKLNAGGP